MGIKLSLQTDFDKIDDVLKAHNLFFEKLEQKGLQAIGAQMVKDVKKANPYKTKGLNQGFYYVTNKQNKTTKVSVSGSQRKGGPTQKIKAAVAEVGAIKSAIRSKYLIFKYNGTWWRSKKAVVKPRPFIEQSYINTSKNIDSILQTVANKWYKKEVEKL
jgi:hypothetical protein